MDALILSRWQFAITTIYHFFFVPLTLGLGWIVAFMQTMSFRTGREDYRKMTRFWGRLFVINFTLGVVTGIVQEFQFGMNWSEYSRYVGDIFGAPLAIEALLAFFLESTFLGIWIFGEGKLPKGVHLASIWLVALGSSLSALFILLANGFMQHPVGYTLNATSGRAELVDFAALVFNPRGWYLFLHTITSGFATAGFFILGISAYHIARGQNLAIFKKSFQISAIVSILGAVTVGLAGHLQSIYLREVQPMAAAASEALWETADPAPFSVVALFDSTGRHEIWSLQVPYGLSLLYYFKPTGVVEGIQQLQTQYEITYGPGNYIPVVALTYWTFRIMVGVGILMIGLGTYALFLVMKNWPAKWTKWLKVLVWAIALPYIANTSGWILTETGRQPWIVHGLLKTSQAVSPNVGTGWLLVSLIGFILVYAILMGADIYLLKKYATTDPDTGTPTPLDTEPVLLNAQD